MTWDGTVKFVGADAWTSQQSPLVRVLCVSAEWEFSPTLSLGVYTERRLSEVKAWWDVEELISGEWIGETEPHWPWEACERAQLFFSHEPLMLSLKLAAVRDETERVASLISEHLLTLDTATTTDEEFIKWASVFTAQQEAVRA